MAENPGKTGHFKIATPEEMQRKIDAYFKACDERTTFTVVGRANSRDVVEVPDPEPYTVTGLALAVGLTSRQALSLYEERDGYAEILKAARAKIVAQWESKLQRLGNNNGVVFWLANQDAWQNKSTQDVNLGGQAGNPIQTESTTTHRLSEDQLEKIKSIMESGGSILD